MTTEATTPAQRRRAEALLRAERERAAATHDADIEYAETVAKLRERFDCDLADALGRRLAAVRPAQRAYNAATVRAESDFAACSSLDLVPQSGPTSRRALAELGRQALVRERFERRG